MRGAHSASPISSAAIPAGHHHPFTPTMRNNDPPALLGITGGSGRIHHIATASRMNPAAKTMPNDRTRDIALAVGDWVPSGCSSVGSISQSEEVRASRPIRRCDRLPTFHPRPRVPSIPNPNNPPMLDWLQDNGNLAIWLTAGSVVMFIGSLIATGILIVRLPADYFAHDKRPPREDKRRGVILRVFRNLAGAILILVGVVLLAMPGQGILTLLVGIMLVDVPGKYRLAKWIVSRGKVLRAMNWLRHKWNKPPLQVAAASTRPSHLSVSGP